MGLKPERADAAFQTMLTEEEKRYLHHMARLRISQALQEETAPLPQPPGSAAGALHAELGAFVTLTHSGRLRGCIGVITGSGPLYRTVAAMAEAAAFADSRFSPVTAAELPHLTLSISIIGPVSPCPDLTGITIGRHGLIICKGSRRGLLLPQVAVEWRWDRETFLAQTCRKAGLLPDAWKQPDAQVFWFEAEVV